jgi:Pentapeptide repeats (8 copies)
MAYVFKERNPPPEWREFKARARYRWLLPFYHVTWAADWAAYMLAKWPLVELLEYLGSFSILFAAIFYFAGASDRLKQKHYQAWQVINTAQGKGGNGGRIDALQELNEDRVALIGVDVGSAYLEGVRLEKAQARRANFSSTDLREAHFKEASLDDADLHWANLRGADLRACSLTGANLNDADLSGANLAGADVAKAGLERADLRGADLKDVQHWQAIETIRQANILGIRNAPDGFVAWARKMGAVETNSD